MWMLVLEVCYDEVCEIVKVVVEMYVVGDLW